MKKIVTIIGARPQFIKASSLSRAIQKEQEIEEIIVHTGQHFDENMSEVFFNQMDIPKPDYFLNINSVGHGKMTGLMLGEIETILLKEKPDYVLVYGDTNSTLAGALAAKKLQLGLIHVEAGLRSFNMAMPEEINRILTDRISDILFCPTDSAIANLYREGFDSFDCRIIKNGDVMQDAALYYSDKAKKPMNDLPDKFILATIHRQENTDDIMKLQTIFNSFNKISTVVSVVIPIHPRTRKLLKKNNILADNIVFIDPVGYLEMIYLIKNCEFVMTDSGGLQKEAFFFEKFCFTLRDQTEWIELIENGCNKLVSINYDELISVVANVPENVNYKVNLYGNGNACDKIIQEILR